MLLRAGRMTKERRPLTPHAARMHRLYRWQARVFDFTRRPILLGRWRLAAAIPAGADVLEVGCGTGHNLPRLARAAGQSGTVLAIDCAPTMLARARRRIPDRVELRQGDYGRDTSASGPRDAIVFSYTLTMIPHYREVLEHARDDLRPGGELIVLDFVDTRFRLMSAWMRASGVALGEERTDCIGSMFEIVTEQDWRGWGGLWRYRLLTARRL